MTFYLFITLLCVLAVEVQTQNTTPTCGVESALNATEAAEILKLHNDYRKAEQASDMIRMEYSTELARRAQEYANGCHYEHGLYIDCSNVTLGQNLHLVVGHNNESDSKFSVESVMNAWMKEKDYYFPENKTCSDSCGHYRQIVYYASREVGCGYARCDILTADEQYTLKKITYATNATFLVCNYRPGQGYGSIFEPGDACAACPPETKCVDGMCERCELEEVGCVCPYTDDQCDAAVNIKNDWDCEFYEKLGDCVGGAWQEWMLDNCAKTCVCILVAKQPARCKTGDFLTTTIY